MVHGIWKLLQELKHGKNYIDNLMGLTKNLDARLQVLNELLCSLQQVHLADRPTKSLFASKSVEFLGHLVGGDSTTIHAEKQEKIRHARYPTTKKEVRLFLGLAKHYRDHIAIIAAIIQFRDSSHCSYPTSLIAVFDLSSFNNFSHFNV